MYFIFPPHLASASALPRETKGGSCVTDLGFSCLRGGNPLFPVEPVAQSAIPVF